MDISVARRAEPSVASSRSFSRLLLWPQEPFNAAEYDDFGVCQRDVDHIADVRALAVRNDDIPVVRVKYRGRLGWQVSELINPATSSSRTRDESQLSTSGMLPSADDWIRRLSTPGRDYDEAVAQLHELLLRAARSQVSRMREANVLGAVRREEIIHSAADDAAMSVLSKLSTFEGRSAFTTWAYKFGILQAANEVRRDVWRDREINLDDVPEQHQKMAPSPEMYAEGHDLAQAVRDGLRDALTPHQRRVAVAVLIDEVPVDVLAERLGINRNALYKTLHDARQRLRAHLSARDFLLPMTTPKEVTK